MIDKQLAGFLEEGLIIHIGSRNAALEPNGARVTAVRVEPDGAHIVAYVPAAAAGRVLPNLQANGQAALVFVRPTDERGCQIKGVCTGIVDAADDERAFVIGQWERQLETLELVGLPRATSSAWTMWPCVAVRVRAAALFSQTPGPGAGAPLT
jgi:hypothetical protein